MNTTQSVTFYVMHCVDGDECLLANLPTIEEAVARMRDEQKRDPRAEMSVWSSVGGIVAV